MGTKEKQNQSFNAKDAKDAKEKASLQNALRDSTGSLKAGPACLARSARQGELKQNQAKPGSVPCQEKPGVCPLLVYRSSSRITDVSESS
jgi:hypothetical protein